MKSEEHETEKTVSADDMAIAERIIANLLVKQWLKRKKDVSEKLKASHN